FFKGCSTYTYKVPTIIVNVKNRKHKWCDVNGQLLRVLIKLQRQPPDNGGCLINTAQHHVPFAQLVQVLLHCPGYRADGCLIHPLSPLPVLRANGARILRPLLQQAQSSYLEWFVHTLKYHQQG